MNEPHMQAVNSIASWSAKSDGNAQIVDLMLWCLTNPGYVALLLLACVLGMVLFELTSENEEKTD